MTDQPSRPRRQHRKRLPSPTEVRNRPRSSFSPEESLAILRREQYLGRPRERDLDGPSRGDPEAKPKPKISLPVLKFMTNPEPDDS